MELREVALEVDRVRRSLEQAKAASVRKTIRVKTK